MNKESNENWRGKVGKMSEVEINDFFAEGPICRLGCLDEDGWPYIAPCWFEYKDGGFYIIPRARSIWAKHIQRDGRVFLCIDESSMMNRRVLVKGEATVLEEPNIGGRWVEIGRPMAVRYLGERGPDYVEPTMVEPRWLLFVRPLTMKSWQGVDWHKRYKHGNW